MVTIHFQVNKQVITYDCPQRLVVAGSREFVYATFTLDKDWDGLTVTAIFENDFVMQPYSRILSGNDPVEVPTEVLVTGKLRVSLMGLANGGNTVVPTAMMRNNPIQVVQNGPLMGLSSLDTNPALWEQVLAAMGSLADLKTENKSNLVAAINELAASSGGAISPEEIASAVEAYLKENPPQVDIQIDDTLSDTSQNPVQNQVVTAALQSKADAESLNSWAFRELFSPEDLEDPGNRNSIIEIDGVEYYRYHASGNNFTWTNPRPRVGSVTITARGVSQYGGTGNARLLTFYDDGTSGPYLVVVANGEPQTVTVTTEAGKTVAKITGNYDLENWVLLDLSVMSVKQDEDAALPFASADAAGGVKADQAEASDTVPARLGKDGRLYVTPSGTVSGDYIPVPTTASVGQTIKVTAVDEAGKPTAWEAADFPSGGGGDYTLPVATSETLGGVQPEEKTDTMTKPVGVDAAGALWTEPGDDTWELIEDITTEEEIKTLDTGYWEIPRKKIRVLLDTLAAAANVNYMPTVVFTGDNYYSRIIRFYPVAMPRTTEMRSLIDVEILNDTDVKVKNFYGYVHEDGLNTNFTYITGSEMVWTPIDGYGNNINPQITGTRINTYGTFAAGTRLRIWGVKK